MIKHDDVKYSLEKSISLSAGDNVFALCILQRQSLSKRGTMDIGPYLSTVKKHIVYLLVAPCVTFGWLLTKVVTVLLEPCEEVL